MYWDNGFSPKDYTQTTRFGKINEMGEAYPFIIIMQLHGQVTKSYAPIANVPVKFWVTASLHRPTHHVV